MGGDEMRWGMRYEVSFIYAQDNDQKFYQNMGMGWGAFIGCYNSNYRNQWGGGFKYLRGFGG